MIVTSMDEGCITITINRPERRNAITNAMYVQLQAALIQAQNDTTCHSVILTGKAGHFTAGNDIVEFQREGGAEGGEALSFLRTLASIDVPVLAAVEGSAVGIGVTLLQHCDFVYASETARFSMPFVALGLCLEGGASILMEQIVGRRKAAEWLLLGKPFTAPEALESGFITAVSVEGHALNDAQATAAVFKTMPVSALRLSKLMLRKHQDAALTQAFDAEYGLFLERLKSSEAQTAFKQFFYRKS